MVGRVLSIYTTAAMITAIAGMSTFGWVTQTFDERTGVFGIALAMFGTAALAVALTRWVRVRQPKSTVSESATDLRRRATD